MFGPTLFFPACVPGTGFGIRTLHEALSRGELMARTLDMATGAVTLGPARTADGVYFNETRLTTIHGPRYRTLVIGAGQLSIGLDYQVVVCDPREEYVHTWDVPSTRARAHDA